MVKTRGGGGVDVEGVSTQSRVMLYLLREQKVEVVGPVARRTRLSMKLAPPELERPTDSKKSYYKICDREDSRDKEKEGEIVLQRLKALGRAPADCQLIRFPFKIPLMRVDSVKKKMRMSGNQQGLVPVVDLGNPELTSNCSAISPVPTGHTKTKRCRGRLPEDSSNRKKSREGEIVESIDPEIPAPSIGVPEVLEPISETNVELQTRISNEAMDMEDSFSSPVPSKSSTPITSGSAEAGGFEIRDSAETNTPFQVRMAKLRAGMKARAFKRHAAFLQANPPHFPSEVTPMAKAPTVQDIHQWIEDGKPSPSHADLKSCPSFGDLLKSVGNKFCNGMSAGRKLTSMDIMRDITRRTRLRLEQANQDEEVAGPSSALGNPITLNKHKRKVNWAPIIARKKSIPALLGQPLGEDEEIVTTSEEEPGTNVQAQEATESLNNP